MTENQGHSSAITKCDVEKALSDLIGAFATDDYQLSVLSCGDGFLRLAIEAGPSACAECLVPEPMLAGLVRNSLPKAIAFSTIQIRYPEVAKSEAASNASSENLV